MHPRDNIRILHFADTHLGFDYPIKPRIERRRRGYDFFDNFHSVLDYAAASRVDLVVHGGDLFFRSSVPARIIDLTCRALFEFADSGIPVVIVPGNHERSRLPASLYLSHPNIYVFVEPATYTFLINDVRVCVSGFPFERHSVRSSFGRILARTGWEEAAGDIKLLCFHQAVEGARVGPWNFTFRRGADVIKFGDLPGSFHAILAGHIHRKQILTGVGEQGTEAPCVVYPGSIERTSFAEKDEEKGFYELTFGSAGESTWRVKLVDFHNLPARPMIDLVIDGGATSDNIELFLRSQIAKIDKNAVVRIRCKDGENSGLGKTLTGGFLRSAFPPTMNYQISSGIFRPRKDKPGR